MKPTLVPDVRKGGRYHRDQMLPPLPLPLPLLPRPIHCGCPLRLWLRLFQPQRLTGRAVLIGRLSGPTKSTNAHPQVTPRQLGSNSGAGATGYMREAKGGRPPNRGAAPLLVLRRSPAPPPVIILRGWLCHLGCRRPLAQNWPWHEQCLAGFETNFFCCSYDFLQQ